MSFALDYLVELFMAIAPQDPASMWIKRALLRWRGATVGKGVKIWRGVWVDEYRGLSLGPDVTIGKSVMLLCGGGVRVGERTMIGHGSQIISGGHRIPASRNESTRWSGPELGLIEIGSDAWIGAGAIILPGVTVGNGAIVAAGAVVSSPVNDYCVVAGVPARTIRVRD